MPRMLRSPRTWRSSPQPTVLLAPSRRTRRTCCWTSLLISRRERLARTIVDLIHSSTSSLGQHQLRRPRTVGGPHAPVSTDTHNRRVGFFHLFLIQIFKNPHTKCH